MHFQATSAFLLFACIGSSSAQNSTTTQPSSTTLASTTSSQTSSGTALVTPTVNLFIPNDAIGGKIAYVASIVSACSDQTVYALRCTSGSLQYTTCDAAIPALTATEGPNSYIFNYNTQVVYRGTSVSASVAESCSLSGTSAAQCGLTVSLSAAGTSTAISSTTLLQGTNYHRYDVPITAGADKTLTAASATCKPNAAAGKNMKTVLGMGVTATIAVIGILMI